MSTVMKASEFIAKLKDVAENYKTLYVMGCFGAPMTSSNKTRYCNNHDYNKKVARTKMIQAASEDTFGFDCVCLVKGILWGWKGDKSKTYGGADYASNGVPDITADAMITKCSGVSASGWADMVPGEAVWCSGHIGVYIGDGLAVECTPAWKNCVQITAVRNIGTKSGYNARTWTKHGKLPYIEYDSAASTTTATPTASGTVTATATKVDYAQKYDKALAGTYKVNASSGLHIRAGAGTSKTSLGVLKNGAMVSNYGYYSLVGTAKWLYVQTADGVVGFCSAAYLKKC